MTLGISLTTQDYLNYSNFQMASEAFLLDDNDASLINGDRLIRALKLGSGPAS